MKRTVIGWMVLAAVLAAMAATREAAAQAPKAAIRPLPASMPAVERKGDTVVTETWDWAKAMIPVARKFKGTPGTIVLMGDSITYANQSTRWARAGKNAKGATAADKAILKWSHADDGKKETNGWWMAAADRPGGRSETAASGIRTDQYIKGGFRKLPSLAAILKKFNPQVAVILLGSNDARGRKPDDVLKDMNTIVEMVLNNGTVPVLTTLPPARSERMHANVREINKRYLSLAAARKLPVIDLYGEFVSRRPKGAWAGTLVGPDGVHLTHALASGPPTKDNLANCGYLLRCWLTVQKLKPVKAKVIDRLRGQAGPHVKPTPKPAQGKVLTPWGKAKVGDWVKYKSMQAMTMTMEVVKVEATVVHVKTTVAAGGKAMPGQVQPLPRFATGGQPQGMPRPADAEFKDLGSETLTIAGKKIKCKVGQVKMKAGGRLITSKVWTSDDVPGGMVRTLSDAMGKMQVMQEVVAFKKN